MSVVQWRLVDWSSKVLTRGPKDTITLGGQMVRVVANSSIPENELWFISPSARRR
jgi:hypothetical protein